MIRCSFVGIRKKNQKEPNALEDIAFAETTEEAMSPISGLTHAQHRQVLVLLDNDGALTGNPFVSFTTSNISGKTKEEWIVDRCSTNHVTHDINSLSNKIVHTNLPPVQISNGNMMKIHAWAKWLLEKD